MRTIRLYGELGKRFTRSIKLDVKSPAEAVRALCANFKGFEKFMINSEKMGMGFKLVVAGEACADADDIRTPRSGDIKIIPIILGSSAEVRILIGAVIIAASLLIPGSTPFVAGTVGSIAFGIGVSLVLGGVAQLLTPVPKAGEPPEKPENTPSKYFNGPVNTSLQGQAVPLAYGRVICGSAIVSAGISLDQVKAGYRVVLTDATVDIDAVGLETSYSQTPPANYYRRELISYTPGLIPVWVWRFYYYEETLVPL